MARCATDLAVLEQALEAPEAVEPGTLRQTVHRMAGAAGTFGFPDLGRIAGEVDDHLIEHGRAPAAELLDLIRAVRALVDKAPEL